MKTASFGVWGISTLPVISSGILRLPEIFVPEKAVILSLDCFCSHDDRILWGQKYSLIAFRKIMLPHPCYKHGLPHTDHAAKPILVSPLLLMLDAVRNMMLLWSLNQDSQPLLHLKSAWPCHCASSLAFSRNSVPLTGRCAAFACCCYFMKESSTSGIVGKRILVRFVEWLLR